MENKSELPVEVVNAVHLEAEEVYNRLDELAREACHVDYGLPMFHKVKEPIETALTAYATQLHQVQQENAELRRQNDKLKEQAEGWRPLLESVLREDTLRGTISTPTIEKITKFLYGE